MTGSRGDALRIASLAFRSPEDISYWSNIPYWTVRKLSERAVTWSRTSTTNVSFAWRSIRSNLRAGMLGRIWLPERSGAFLAMLRLWIAATLHQDHYDIIFCDGSIQAACVAPGKPVVNWTDAEVESYLRAYLGPERVKRVVNLAQARAQEQRGLDRAARSLRLALSSIREPVRRRLRAAPAEALANT